MKNIKSFLIGYTNSSGIICGSIEVEFYEVENGG